MQDLSLHILDIVENATRAKAKTIAIEVLGDQKKDQLVISIKDDGEGMSKNMCSKVLDPFFTTKDGKRFGLGLSLFRQAARQTGGDLKIDSHKGEGTTITAIFKSGHPDMKPIGDILETMANLIVAHPSIRFIYDYKGGKDKYHFDSFVKQ